jgi:hypothetical protein
MAQVPVKDIGIQVTIHFNAVKEPSSDGTVPVKALPISDKVPQCSQGTKFRWHSPCQSIANK